MRKCLVFMAVSGLGMAARAADISSLPGMAPATSASASASSNAPAVKGHDLCRDNFDGYKQSLMKDPEQEKVWNEFRACTAEMKRWSDALDVSQAAIAKGTQQPGPHLMLGVSYLHTKEYEKASDEFDQAIALKHDQPMAYYYLAMAHLFLHQPDKAAQAAETAVEMEPNNPSNQSQLAYAYLLLDQQDKCEAAGKKAIALDPNNVAAYKVLGNLYAKQGKKEESDKMFEAAIHANGRTTAAAPFVADKVVATPAPVARKEAPPADDNEDPEQSCREQWAKLKNNMAEGNIGQALSYFSDYLDTREQYRKAFERMGEDKAKEVFAGMGDLEDCQKALLVENCKATLTMSRNGEIRSIEETIRCERNEDKVWRIRSF